MTHLLDLTPVQLDLLLIFLQLFETGIELLLKTIYVRKSMAFNSDQMAVNFLKRNGH